LPGEGGQAGSGEGIVDWVLTDFSKDEQEILVPVLDVGANLLMQTFYVEPETLLKEWAKKKISIEDLVAENDLNTTM
jgi:peptidyl-tRNA hydrolase